GLRGKDLQREPVVAVAKARRFRAVVEHVALMPAAARAVVLSARIDELVVDLGLDPALDDVVEARPAGAAVELRARLEQWQRAARADERSLPLLFVQRARERPLGAFLAQDVELRGREQYTPFVVGLHHLGRERGRIGGERGRHGRTSGERDCDLLEEMTAIHGNLRLQSYRIGRPCPGRTYEAARAACAVISAATRFRRLERA